MKKQQDLLEGELKQTAQKMQSPCCWHRLESKGWLCLVGLHSGCWVPVAAVLQELHLKGTAM